jgi:hypothetical protein
LVDFEESAPAELADVVRRSLVRPRQLLGDVVRQALVLLAGLIVLKGYAENMLLLLREGVDRFVEQLTVGGERGG